jgi:hypothetical protein
MGLQVAREMKQPGETLRYSMEFVPGARGGLAIGDTLTGSPTVRVYDRTDGSDVTSIMIEGTPGIQDNTVFFFLKGGIDGRSYAISIKVNTTFGEKNVQEVLVIHIKKYIPEEASPSISPSASVSPSPSP